MQEETLDLRRYLEVVVNWWWIILLGPVLIGILTFLSSARQVPLYEATTTILVQQTRTSALPNVDDIQISQALANTYQKLVTTRPILQEVISELGLSASPAKLAGQVSATVVPGAPLLQIKAKTDDPTKAALIANTLGQVFMDRTRDNRLAEIARLQAAVRAQGLEDSSTLIQAQLNALGSLILIEPAEVPRSPLSSRTTLKISLAVLLGGAVALGLAFLLDYLNDSVRSPERLERLLGLPNLGMVFRWNKKQYPYADIVTRDHPKSTFAEAFRQVRANIHFALATHPTKALVVTSAGMGEGKSTVVINVATAQAMSGTKVVIVDADLRRPSVHRFFGLPNDIGLSTLLANATVPLEQALRPTDVEGLWVLPSGPIPPNPAELLGSPRMRALSEELRKYGDFVLYDTPPVLPLADAVVMASQVGSALLVADALHTHVHALKSALENFHRAGVSPLGVVLNKFRPRRLAYGYGYYYNYYYRYYAPSVEGSEDGAKSSPRRHHRGWVRRMRRRLTGLLQRPAER